MKNKGYSFNKKVYIAVIVTLTVILSAFILPVSGASDNIAAISEIILNKAQTELTVKINLSKEYVAENKSDTLYLFELRPHESEENVSLSTPIADFKTESKITVKLPYENGISNRLYSRFVIAEESADGRYTPISSAHFIDNFSDYAKNSEPIPRGSSKKGLIINSFTDAQLLGVQHTVIDIPVNEYMYGEMTDGATSFVFGGRTHYINENRLLMLDHTVRTYTEAGINVYFNILLTAPKSDYHPDILSLYYDGISPDSQYFALNTHSEAAMNLFAAFMDFICQRYTSPDHMYGLVPAIILGSEVNSGKGQNDFGGYPAESYISSYVSAYRVAYTAMRSHYSQGLIYISLSNEFNLVPENGVSAKEFINSFNNEISESGNIPWGLSINPFPSSPGISDYWNDNGAQADSSSKYITMKNIGVLIDYMGNDELLFGEDIRSIIVGKFGIDGSPDNDTSMTMQAAAYALAYYTADQNEHIDAFIYSNHVDIPNEKYHYGMWTSKEGEVALPSAKKPMYNVFSLIDTSRSEEVTAFVKQTVGDEAFHAYLPDKIKYKVFDDRTLISDSSVSSAEIKKGLKSSTLFDLTAGKLCNFYPSDGTEYVELRPLSDGSGTMLYSRITDIPTEYKGIENPIEKPSAFKNARYITVRVMVEAPVEVSTVNLMLRLQKNGSDELDTAVFDGTCRINPNEWHDITFKIDELTKASKGEIDLLKLWINADDREPIEGTYGIWLENVVLHTKKGMSFISGFFIFLLVIVGIAVVGYVILYIRAQYIRRRRRAEAERRRMQAMRQNQRYNQSYGGNSPQNR